MTTYKAHCLILPFPGQGHINPMLQFAKRLQSKRVKITIALTKFFLKNMKELPTSVSIEAISDGYDDGGRDQAGSFVAYVTRFKEVGSDTLSQLIQKLENCGCPVNCIVYDPFLPWAVEVAKNFRLVSAAFFTQNCAVDNIYYHVHKGVIKLPPTQNDEEILIPGFSSTIEASDVPSFVISPEAERILEMLANQFSNLDKVDWVLINSFHELEKEVIDWMSKIYPIKTIGPTIPSIYLDKRLHDDKEYGLSIFKPMTNECLNWLNHQPISSVVYVSFGSLAKLEGDQMEELAWGLKNSNNNFLWVVRSTEESKLPKDFLEPPTPKSLTLFSSSPKPTEAAIKQPLLPHHKPPSLHPPSSKHNQPPPSENNQQPSPRTASSSSEGSADQQLLHSSRLCTASNSRQQPHETPTRTPPTTQIPQARVRVPIRCFLTHCGWNSTLEAISLGVPMVAMPQWIDQPTNAKFVKDVWKIGVRAKLDEKGIVRREVIEECIKLVMEEEKGKLIRENAKKWKEIARNVVDEGGSSDKNIEEFVSKLVTIS
ncbi:UDP-glycosyltransferase 74F1-like [Solanum tuberosum]|uniref:UDP-glycosyltransferase 74F1-like n=1 Tax=Solanum tuberosum TaxID=4113 RepID=UPI00073A3FF8|nr:PREDICTED: UDP-glycosyltransferase 74F1-like [Solanum tuberosum]